MRQRAGASVASTPPRSLGSDAGGGDHPPPYHHQWQSSSSSAAAAAAAATSSSYHLQQQQPQQQQQQQQQHLPQQMGNLDHHPRTNHHDNNNPQRHQFHRTNSAGSSHDSDHHPRHSHHQPQELQHQHVETTTVVGALSTGAPRRRRTTHLNQLDNTNSATTSSTSQSQQLDSSAQINTTSGHPQSSSSRRLLSSSPTSDVTAKNAAGPGSYHSSYLDDFQLKQHHQHHSSGVRTHLSSPVYHRHHKNTALYPSTLDNMHYSFDVDPNPLAAVHFRKVLHVPDSEYRQFITNGKEGRNGANRSMFNLVCCANVCAGFSCIAMIVLMFFAILLDSQPLMIQGTLPTATKENDRGKPVTMYFVTAERLDSATHAYQASWAYFFTLIVSLLIVHFRRCTNWIKRRSYQDLPDTMMMNNNNNNASEGGTTPVCSTISATGSSSSSVVGDVGLPLFQQQQQQHDNGGTTSAYPSFSRNNRLAASMRLWWDWAKSSAFHRKKASLPTHNKSRKKTCAKTI